MFSLPWQRQQRQNGTSNHSKERSARKTILLQMHVAREFPELHKGDKFLFLLEGDEAVSTNIESWRGFQKKLWYLNVDPAIGMPAGDIANAPEGIWTEGGELWPQSTRAIFGLPKILEASLKENSTNLKSFHLPTRQVLRFSTMASQY